VADAAISDVDAALAAAQRRLGNVADDGGMAAEPAAAAGAGRGAYGRSANPASPNIAPASAPRRKTSMPLGSLEAEATASPVQGSRRRLPGSASPEPRRGGAEIVEVVKLDAEPSPGLPGFKIVPGGPLATF